MGTQSIGSRPDGGQQEREREGCALVVTDGHRIDVVERRLHISYMYCIGIVDYIYTKYLVSYKHSKYRNILIKLLYHVYK